MTKEKEIPENTLYRLAIYLKILDSLEKKKVSSVSSEDLARLSGVNSAQLRKDLSFVGNLGTKGVGYDVKNLRYNLKKFLGRTYEWNLILGGLNPLGEFLLKNKELQKEGFYFIAAFDTRSEELGKIIDGITVYNLDQLSYVIKAIKVDIGVITDVNNPEIYLSAFIKEGIKSILNLSDIPIFSEDLGIKIENLSFTLALTKLAFYLKNSLKEKV